MALSPTSWGASLNDTTWDHLFLVYGQTNVPAYHWHWTKAQAWQESLFNPAAVSPAGAVGLMQIMPATGRDLRRRTGVSGPLTSPTINVLYGTTYMQQMLRVWKWERPPLERLKLAQASYNAGAGNILAAQRLAGMPLLWGDIQPHLHRVTGHHSLETTTYVQRIARWFNGLSGAVPAADGGRGGGHAGDDRGVHDRPGSSQQADANGDG